jgi:hypothetical protein
MRRKIRRQTRRAIGKVGFSASSFSNKGSSEWLNKWTSSGRYPSVHVPQLQMVWFLLTFLTDSSYPLKILSINSRPNVRCRLLSKSNFGFSLSPPPQLKRPLPDPEPERAVSKHKSEKIQYASMHEGEIEISVGGSVGSFEVV